MIEELFKETLRINNLYHTPERLRIFQVLKDQQGPCSIAKLIELTQNFLDKTTVYRNLELFEQIGIITKVYVGWKYKVELSDQFSPHHHHMTCTNCGQIVVFEESNSFSRELERLQNQHGFREQSHSLELKGLCKNCC